MEQPTLDVRAITRASETSSVPIRLDPASWPGIRLSAAIQTISDGGGKGWTIQYFAEAGLLAANLPGEQGPTQSSPARRRSDADPTSLCEGAVSMRAARGAPRRSQDGIRVFQTSVSYGPHAK